MWECTLARFQNAVSHPGGERSVILELKALETALETAGWRQRETPYYLDLGTDPSSGPGLEPPAEECPSKKNRDHDDRTTTSATFPPAPDMSCAAVRQPPSVVTSVGFAQ